VKKQQEQQHHIGAAFLGSEKGNKLAKKECRVIA
jgi:hypothetical protein